MEQAGRMTAASQTTPATRSEDTDRNIALLAYGLLFAAIFLAGAPALIAVAIAYGRRRSVDCLVSSHHRFQIFIFWIGFAMTLLAALFGLAAALVILVDVFGAVIHAGWENWRVVQAADLHIGRTFFMLVAAAMVMGTLTAVWLLAASAYGFVRLASRHAIRQTER
jgi:uncharacterized membrane protein